MSQTTITKNKNIESVIARKLSLENIGCEELAGSYMGFRFYWVPRTGATRIHGNGKPAAHNPTQKDLLLWVLSRA